MREKNNLEIAEVFRRLEPRIKDLRLSRDQYRIFRSIVSCRTSVLGGHINLCDRCGYKEQSYNSCWNRHCPKCQGGAAFSWVNERSAELLPVPYFHLVFTLPHELNELCYTNKRLMYELLFRASSETLLTVSKKNLGLSVGFFGVLHSWNQELRYHPHLHYLVPGGGIDSSGVWQALPNAAKFFLPVRILSRVFRGKFIAHLKEAYSQRKLFFGNKQSHLNNPQDFEHLISRSASYDWVVYAKRPFATPEVVVKYLAGYTHRVGIANKRLRSIDDSTVSFSARDKTRPEKKKIVRLKHETFLRRFMLHALPKNFRRIRYFGFLTPKQKKSALATIRSQLDAQPPKTTSTLTPKACPECNTGSLIPTYVRKPHSSSPTTDTFRAFNGLSQPLCLSPPVSVN